MQAINEKKELDSNIVPILENVAVYMECVHQENIGSLNSTLIPHFETFLRKLILSFDVLQEVNPLLKMLGAMFKIQGISSHKVGNILNMNVEYEMNQLV